MSTWLLVAMGVLVWSVVGAIVFLASARLERLITKDLPPWAVTLLVIFGGPLVWVFVSLVLLYFRRAPAK